MKPYKPKDENEKRDFITCLGKTPEEYEKLYGVEIIIQGGYVTKEHMKETSFIGIYPSVHDGYKPPINPIPIEIIDIPEEFGNQMVNRCTDICRLPIGQVKQYQCGNTLVAKTDTLNNIFFMDFYHGNSQPFTAFEWILNDFYSKNPKEYYLDRFEQTIQGIDANKVEKIIVTTSFDQDYFIKEGKRQIETAIKTQKNIAESKVNAIKRTLESERLAVQGKIEESNKKSFLEGIKSMKDGWIVRDNRLVFDKDIPMKIFTSHGKNIKAPEGKYFTRGLSITIAPTVNNAFAHEKSNHPNINNTNTVCTGDLQGKPLREFMDKIEKQMEVGNLNSPFNSSIAKEGHTLFSQADNNAIEAEGTGEEYESETSNSLVWNLR